VLDGRPGVHPVPALPGRDAAEKLAGRYLDPETNTTLELAVSDRGELTITTNGMTVTAEVTEDGRFASPRGSSVFALRAAEPDAVEVEQDAGMAGLWHRVLPGDSLPEDLPGTYHSPEMATTWTITQAEGKTWVRASGPVATGPLWEVEPVQGDVMRLHVPGTLFRGWLDVRVLRKGGQVVGLEASGGRVKRVRYDLFPLPPDVSA
jgi:hypothetical protein